MNKYKAAIYIRLSKKDKSLEKSNSIVNQRMIIKNFIVFNKDITEVDEYIDNGYSGINFERPSFKKMICDIQQSKINCIIVKDLSRFSRNYIEAGNYIEKIFPALGIRFISVIDNYDSLNSSDITNNIIVPFKNLFNDYYCNDISLKIKSSLDVKRKNGDFVSPFASYGYRKLENNKNKLIIDNLSANVVKNIFRWKLNGLSDSDICNKLNKFCVLTPYEYKMKNGLNYKTNFNTKIELLWQQSMVRRILKNNLYIGAIEQEKTEIINDKMKEIIKNKKENWKVVDNNNNTIIDKYEFMTVQKMISNKKGENLFSCVSKCAHCKNNMVVKTEKAENKIYIYYICPLNRKNKKLCSSSHRISESLLKESVFYTIKNIIEALFDLNVYEFVNDEYFYFVKEQLKLRIKEVDEYRNYIYLLYKNYFNNIISVEDFYEFKKIYISKYINIKSSILNLKDEINIIQLNKNNKYMNIDYLDKFKSIKYVDKKMINFFISEIKVYNNYRIDIKFNFNI